MNFLFLSLFGLCVGSNLYTLFENEDTKALNPNSDLKFSIFKLLNSSIGMRRKKFRGKRSIPSMIGSIAGAKVVDKVVKHVGKGKPKSKTPSGSGSNNRYVDVGDIGYNNNNNNNQNSYNNNNRNSQILLYRQYYSNSSDVDFTPTLIGANLNNLTHAWHKMVALCDKKYTILSVPMAGFNLCLTNANDIFQRWKTDQEKIESDLTSTTSTTTATPSTVTSTTNSARGFDIFTEYDSDENNLINETEDESDLLYSNKVEYSNPDVKELVRQNRAEITDVNSINTNINVNTTKKWPVMSKKTMSHLQQMLMNIASIKDANGKYTIDYSPLSELPDNAVCGNLDTYLGMIVEFLSKNIGYMQFDPEISSLIRKLEDLMQSKELMILLGTNNGHLTTQKSLKLNVTKLLEYDIESHILLSEYTILPNEKPILYRYYPASMINMALYNLMLMTTDCTKIYLNNYIKDVERIEIIDTGDFVRYISKLPEYVRFFLYFLLFIIGSVVVVFTKNHVGGTNFFHQLMLRIPLGRRRSTIPRPNSLELRDVNLNNNMSPSAPNNNNAIYPNLSSPIDQAVKRLVV